MFNLNIGHHARRFKASDKKLPFIAWAIVSVVVVAVGVRLIFGSHAATAFPTTTSMANVCGAKSAQDMTVATPSSLGAFTFSNKSGNDTYNIAAYPSLLQKNPLGSDNQPTLMDFHIVSLGGKSYIEELLSLGGGNMQMGIYDLSAPATALVTFSLGNWGNNTYSFTSDNAGNVYFMSSFIPGNNQGQTPYIYKYAPFNSSGTLVATSTLAPAAKVIASQGAPVYGYTNSSGSFVVGQTTSVINQLLGKGISNQYDSNLNPIAGGSVISYQDVNQSSNGDFVTIDDGMMYVYKNDGSLKFFMGTDSKPGTDINIVRATSGYENSDGTYYVISEGTGILQFGSNGTYIGKAPDFQIDNGAANTIGYGSRNMVNFNGNSYYFAKGLNAFDGNYNKPGIYSISSPKLAVLTGYPQGTRSILGLGAGITTQTSSSVSVPHNYFPNGTTPQASVIFYPWWSSQISGYSVTYEVRSMDQINANQPGTTQSLTIPALSSTSSTYLPLNLAGNSGPGAYEISAHIFYGGKAVGADCMDYSVGGSGSTYNPTSANFSNPVEVAHQLGQNYVRSTYGVEDCLPGVSFDSTSLSTLPALNCSSVSSLISQETNLAKKYGITYVAQVLNHENNLAWTLAHTNTSSCPTYKTGTTISYYECLSYQLAVALPQINTWMELNEINNNKGYDFSDTAHDPTKTLIIPAYTAIKAAGAALGQNETVIAGSLLDGHNLPYVQKMLDSGAINYMDGLDIHPYPGDNRSYEEQGEIIPPLNANPGESSKLGLLEQIKALIPGKPLSDSEYGVWQKGQSSTYAQPDILVRGTILQNSIGMNNIYAFENNHCYEVAKVEWGTVGCGHQGGDLPGAVAQTVMQSMLYGQTVSANRQFKQWLPTGIPHTYAALYGPSGTDAGSVAVVWADDFTTEIIPSLSGGGSMNITSEFGSNATLSAGSTLNISGQVKYINVPSSQTISFNPTEKFGTNLSLYNSVSNKVSVSASSTVAAGKCSPSNVVLGLSDILNLPSCGPSQTNGWAQSPSDASPSITVSLPSAQNINRLFISTSSIHSVNTNIRNATVQVSADGSNWTTVGTISDNFFVRNWLLKFTTTNVKQIRIIDMTANYSGYAGGLPPTFWPTSATDLNNANSPWFGPTQVYDIEAYAPGQSASSSAPKAVVPNPPSALNFSVKSSNEIDLSWTPATLPSGTSSAIAGYNIFRNGTQVNASNVVTGNSYQDKTVTPGSSYDYSVQTYDNSSPSNLSAISAPITAAPYPLPGTPALSASATNSDLVNLTWTASTDVGGPGIAAYYITRTNGTNVTKFTVNSPLTTFADNSVIPSTSYSYSVQAVDMAGDLSNVSISITVNTPNPIDKFAPSVPVISTGTSTYNSINLSWSASTDTGGSGLSGYALYRDGIALASFNSSTISYVDNSVSASTKYSYTITASDNAGNTSSQSVAATITTPAKPIVYPTTPGGLSSSASAFNSVNLSWSASTDVGGPGLGGYYILRTTAGVSTAVNIATVGPSTTNYTDASAQALTQYTYQVQAFDTGSPTPVVSQASTGSTVTTPQDPQLIAPAAPVLTSITTVSPSQINLSWTESSTNAASFDIYQVGLATPIASGITTTSFGVTGLNPNTSYSFYIIALNSAKTKSPVSNTLSASTLINLSPTLVTLSGIVTSNRTGLPISGATVKTGYKATASGVTITTSTNSEGYYSIVNIVPDTKHWYYSFAANYYNTNIFQAYPAGNATQNIVLNHK